MTKLFRILHVIPSVDASLGGTVASVCNLSKAMVSRGHNVEVVTIDCSKTNPNLRVPMHGVGRPHFKYAFSLGLFFWLWKNSKQYDIVIVNGMWQFHGVCVFLNSLLRRVRYVICSHGMLTSYCVRNDTFKYFKKYIYWVLIEYWVSRFSAGILATSAAEMASSKTCLPGASKLHFVMTSGGVEDPCVSQLPVDCDKWHYDSKSDSKIIPDFVRANGYLLFLGRIDPIKGIDILIEAFALANGVRDKYFLVLAGPGTKAYCDSLKSIESKLGLGDRVVWVGAVDGAPKWNLIHEASALVLASHHENFSNVAVEALAVGTPVLTTDRVGVAPAISGWNAGIVGADTVIDFAKVLEEWGAKEVTEILRFRDSARRCYVDEFSVNQWALRVEHVIESVLTK